jgi:glycosyltransferase involved in cell wall biosynthesis
MRILDVSPRKVHPPLSGARVRTYNLLRRLARSHDVRHFWQPRPRDRRRPEQSDYQEIGHSDPVAAAITELGWRSWASAPIPAGAALQLTRPAALTELIRWADVVMVEFPWQFEYCRRRVSGTPLVLATHNVEAEKFLSWGEAAGARLARRPWLRYVERAERGAARAADLITVVKEGDREGLARRYGADPERIVVVANGADTRRYRPADPERRELAKGELGLPERPVAIYVGCTQPANRAGFEWVRRAARRSDDFNFVVVGRVGSGAEGHDNLTIAGPVDELGPWLEAADVALCPIEHGGGTKIKLLESLAAGLPTIAFAASVDGLAARDGEHLMICEPNERALLAALERLRDEPQLAARIGEAARALATTRYDWEMLGDVMETALTGLVEGASRGDRGREATDRKGERPREEERPRA